MAPCHPKQDPAGIIKMKIHPPGYSWQPYAHGSISLCMIMRDNAAVLPRCLDSVRGLVNEIIIVDTGSVDNSIEVARAYGAKILVDPWQEDFARPRNIGLKQATGQWILVLDPDEVIRKADHDKIRALTTNKVFKAFWVTTRNYAYNTGEAGYRACGGDPDPAGTYPGYIPSTKTRIFKNGLGIVFKGCWHELVDWYLIAQKIRVLQTDLYVHHWPHESFGQIRKEKAEMYLRMGEKKVREWPTHGKAWWELAVAEMIQGYRNRACHSIAQAFRFGFGSQQQFFSLARCLNMLGKKNESSLAFEKGICRLFSNLTHIDVAKKKNGALLDDL